MPRRRSWEGRLATFVWLLTLGAAVLWFVAAGDAEADCARRQSLAPCLAGLGALPWGMATATLGLSAVLLTSVALSRAHARR